MIKKLFGYLQGRTTTFAVGFFVMGNVLQWLHRLDGQYTTFMVAFMGVVVAHSYKEDVANRDTDK